MTTTCTRCGENKEIRAEIYGPDKTTLLCRNCGIDAGFIKGKKH